MTPLENLSNIDLINRLHAANSNYLAATKNYYPVGQRTQEHTDAHDYLAKIIQEVERRKAIGAFLS